MKAVYSARVLESKEGEMAGEKKRSASDDGAAAAPRDGER